MSSPEETGFRKKFLTTSVGQKYITAVSGLALIGFVIAHLLGNLTLLAPSSGPFNTYAHKLQSLGPGLWVAEIGLIVLFGAHIINGILLKRMNSAARPERYGFTPRSKGGPSQSSPSSRNMIVSGMILLGFLILHIVQFRLGPGITQGYRAVLVDGQQARDLHRLVVETFQNPVYVLVYVGAMLFLWAHLRHGFWSAFQSLGASSDRSAARLRAVGILVAALLGVGFLAIPMILFARHALVR